MCVVTMTNFGMGLGAALQVHIHVDAFITLIITQLVKKTGIRDTFVRAMASQWVLLTLGRLVGHIALSLVRISKCISHSVANNC